METTNTAEGNEAGENFIEKGPIISVTARVNKYFYDRGIKEDEMDGACSTYVGEWYVNICVCACVCIYSYIYIYM